MASNDDEDYVHVVPPDEPAEEKDPGNSDGWYSLEWSEVPIQISMKAGQGHFEKAQTAFAKNNPTIYETLQLVVSSAPFPFSITLELPRLADDAVWLRHCTNQERRRWVKEQFRKALRTGAGYAFSCFLRFSPLKLIDGICYVIEEMVKKQPAVTETETLPPHNFEMEINGEKVIFTFANKSGQPKPDVQNQDRTRVGKITTPPPSSFGEPNPAAATGLLRRRRMLDSPWTFWLVDTYDESEIISYHTVRSLFELLRKNRHFPTKLDKGSVLHFSKGDTKPWENSDAVNGDKWIATYSGKKCDDPWLDTLLALVEGKFIHGDEICVAITYATVTQRRIALCTKKDTNDAAQVCIGKQWSGILAGRGTITFHVGGEMIDHKKEAAIFSEVEAEMFSEKQRAQVASPSEGIKDAQQTMVSEKQRKESAPPVISQDSFSEKQRAQVASASEGIKDAQQTMVSEKQRKESAPPVISQDSISEKTMYFLAEATYSFIAASEKELSLSVGDYVVVRKVSPSGWSEGECKGKGGWFPSAYVEKRGFHPVISLLKFTKV